MIFNALPSSKRVYLRRKTTEKKSSRKDAKITKDAKEEWKKKSSRKDAKIAENAKSYE